MSTVSIQHALQTALSHLHAGRAGDAEGICRQILSAAPEHPQAMHVMGVIAAQTGRFPLAIDLVRRCVTLNPTPEMQSDLGLVLMLAGQLEESVAELQKAIQIGPNCVSAHSNLGDAFAQMGRTADAIECYRNALRINPRQPMTHMRLASSLRSLGKITEAIEAYRAAIQLDGSSAIAHNDLGAALELQGEWEAAIAEYQTALRLDPRLAAAQVNLGNAYQVKQRFDEAINAFCSAITLRPDMPEAHFNLGNVLKDVGELQPAIESYRRALQLDDRNHLLHSNLLYSIWFDPLCDNEMLKSDHALWRQRVADSLKSEHHLHDNHRDPDRRLRVGYVSPDFRAHSAALFLHPLLKAHDRQAVEIHCYASVRQPDEITERLKSAADIWHDALSLSDAELAQRIRGDSIDILVDLTMHMRDNRLLTFARKPAPVQVAYLAYPGTTGLDCMDYRISDPYLDPPGGDESVYTEETIRLPSTFWCYDPTDEGLEAQTSPVLGGQPVTFGSLNNICKINADVLDLWAKVLRGTPGSRMLILSSVESHRRRMLHHFQAAQVDDKRIQFVTNCSRREYMEIYDRIDIGLDTFPANGHTTTMDALWMGVPVVSLPGATAISRGGLSVLTNIGLAELVASSPTEYVSIASELAGNHSRLTELRRTMRPRMLSSPLMDAPLFARDLESAYRTMWRRWCAQP